MSSMLLKRLACSNNNSLFHPRRNRFGVPAITCPPLGISHQQRQPAVRRMCQEPSCSTSTASFTGATAPELQSWLEQRGVDTSAYGLGMSKTVQELLDEIQLHESVVVEEPCGPQEVRPVRVVRVVSLRITNASGLSLFEEEQVLPDGRSRRRDLLLSEKMVGEERWQDAALRAVAEELGTVLPADYEVQLKDGTYHCCSELSASLSYPGLTTRYIFHRVNAKVSGLPCGNFSTQEPRANGTLLTKWVWRSANHCPEAKAFATQSE